MGVHREDSYGMHRALYRKRPWYLIAGTRDNTRKLIFDQLQEHDRLLARLEADSLRRLSCPSVTPKIFFLSPRHELPVFCIECSSTDAIVWGRTGLRLSQ